MKNQVAAPVVGLIVIVALAVIGWFVYKAMQPTVGGSSGKDVGIKMYQQKMGKNAPLPPSLKS